MVNYQSYPSRNVHEVDRIRQSVTVIDHGKFTHFINDDVIRVKLTVCLEVTLGSDPKRLEKCLEVTWVDMNSTLFTVS